MLFKTLALAASMLLLASAAGRSPAPKSAERLLPVGSTFEWTAAKYKHFMRLRAGNLHIAIAPVRSDDLVTPTVTVTMAGSRPVVLPGSSEDSTYDNGTITVGRWDRAGRLFVMVSNYSGGTHCCELIRFVVPVGPNLKIVSFGEKDGRAGNALPRDLDGDGRPDLVLVDDAFLYTFSDYADSIAPPLIFNIVNGRIVDVSKRPSFAAIFRNNMRAAREGCLHPEPDTLRNGACAAYVADAARLGQFERAWKAMLRVYDRKSDWPYPDGCRVKLDRLAECPKAATIRYANFPDALRGFLKDLGYIKG